MSLQLGEQSSRGAHLFRSRSVTPAVQTESTFGQLDSRLIISIGNVKRGAEILARPDISGTTRREVLDRTFRAIGKGVLDGKTDYATLATVEDRARTFYADFYLHGTNMAVYLPKPLVLGVGDLGVEKSNRNLAAAFWEQHIQQKVAAVKEALDGKADPVVVSLAFGGTEPALLLSASLDNCPIVHVKIMPDGAARYLADDVRVLDGKDWIMVDDTTRTGKTLVNTESLLLQEFEPSSLTKLIIKDYS